MLRTVLLSLISLAMILSSAWALLALWFQAPWGVPGRYGLMGLWLVCALGLGCWLWSGGIWQGILGYLCLYALLLFWWATLEPSNQRDWADDLAHITTGQVKGDEVTLHHVRNFNWRTREDYDVSWETRQYDLSRLRTVDMITSYWGLSSIAHVLVSFGFEDGEQVVFSVEIRRERHEKFSELGGFFKQFELSIIASDERDSVRVRTNVRDEDAWLYRVNLTEEEIRELFRSFVGHANELAEHPRFYHTITGNCTTIVFSMMKQIVEGLPLDYRLLLTGYLPDYVYQVGGLQPGLPLEALQRRGRFTERARDAGDAADFSALIRQGVPGWDKAQR